MRKILKNIMLISIFLIVGVASTFFLISQLSFLGEQQCVIPAGGGSCEITLSLPASSEFKTLTPFFSFDSVEAGSFIGKRQVFPIQTLKGINEGSDNTFFTYQIFEIPAEWHGFDIKKIQIDYELGGTAVCNRKTDTYFAQADLEMEIHQINYPITQDIPVCTLDRTKYCREQYGNVFVFNERSGDDSFLLEGNTRLHNSKVVDCDGIETATGYSNATGVSVVQKPLSSTRFSTVIREEYPERSFDRGTINDISSKTFVSYKLAEYPADLKFSINDNVLLERSGVEKTNFSNYDFSQAANSICSNTEELCVFNFTIESSTGGIITYDFDTVYQPRNSNGTDPQDNNNVLLYVLFGVLGAVLLIGLIFWMVRK